MFSDRLSVHILHCSQYSTPLKDFSVTVSRICIQTLYLFQCSDVRIGDFLMSATFTKRVHIPHTNFEQTPPWEHIIVRVVLQRKSEPVAVWLDKCLHTIQGGVCISNYIINTFYIAFDTNTNWQVLVCHPEVSCKFANCFSITVLV